MPLPVLNVRARRISRTKRPTARELPDQELHRLAEFGKLTACLIHEISNPLTAAMLQLEQVGHSSSTVQQARRNMHIIRRYIEVARQQLRQESEIQNFMVGGQIAQLRQLVLPLAKRAGITLVIEPIPSCQIHGDPVKFQQIMMNLIVNAIDAYEDSSAQGEKLIRISVSINQRWLTVRVRDWGSGIANEQFEHLFKPFYSTKSKAGQGLGIGLALVEQYMQNDFRGSIRATSSFRGGTQFTAKFRLSAT